MREYTAFGKTFKVPEWTTYLLLDERTDSAGLHEVVAVKDFDKWNIVTNMWCSSYETERDVDWDIVGHLTEEEHDKWLNS